MFNREFRELEDMYDGALLESGYDNALIGIVTGPDDGFTSCYDRSRCIAMLMTRCDMSATDAEEYFSFNVESVRVGDRAPVFIDKTDPLDSVSES